ncbi:DUF5330 domain-containing protein [Rhizobium helianthi]|uniref:DUF5330 domain-containing protein n=1 Tax=Rhizobium helianthi TaxID=1132695 RepID=A0ABW4M7D1_9HYPH
MWFLIKTSFVFGMGLVVLSYFSTQTPEGPNGAQSQIQLTDALSAASEAYGYISRLCTEKPEVCEKGGETFTALTIRAKEGARVAYEFLDKQLAGESKDTPKLAANDALSRAPDAQPLPPRPEAAHLADEVTTGTVPLPMKRPDR